MSWFKIRQSVWSKVAHFKRLVIVDVRHAADWLAQLFERESAQFIEATLCVEGAPLSLIDVEVRRLDGTAGPLAVATFRPSTAETPPSRDPLTGLPDRRAIGAWIAGLRRGATGPPPQRC